MSSVASSVSVPCPRCGSSLAADELRFGDIAICAGCTHHFLYQPQPETLTASRKAEWSLLLAIASLLFFCLTAVPALILGAWALVDIHRHKGRLRGRNVAVTALVLAVLCCFLSLIVWALLLPAINLYLHS